MTVSPPAARPLELEVAGAHPLAPPYGVPTSVGPVELERYPRLESARADWEQLGPQTASPYLTWDWAACWWEAFGAGRELLLHGVRRPGEPVVAILPLYLAARNPVRVGRLLGHGEADQLGFVCHPGDHDLAAQGLRGLAREHLGRRGALLLDRLPEGHAHPGSSAQLLTREPTPLLPMAGLTWEEWLASRSSRFRRAVRRYERKLVEEHGLVMRKVQRADEVAPAMEVLAALHDARWEGASSTFAGARGTFLRAFAQRALDRDWLQLWIAEVEATPIAALMGYRVNGVEWGYEVGRDPAWSAHDVGFVLLAHTLREAFGAGVTEYRFGRGDQSYKGRFASEMPSVETFAVGSAPVALLGRGAVAALRRSGAWGRRRLVELGL